MKTYKIGSTTEKQTLVYAGVIEINPSESVEIFELPLTGAATINIGATAKPTEGDRIILKASSDGTARDVTFGTGITAPVLAGVINKTKVQEFVYDGAGFVAVSAPVQID